MATVQLNNRAVHGTIDRQIAAKHDITVLTGQLANSRNPLKPINVVSELGRKSLPDSNLGKIEINNCENQDRSNQEREPQPEVRQNDITTTRSMLEVDPSKAWESNSDPGHNCADSDSLKSGSSERSDIPEFRGRENVTIRQSRPKRRSGQVTIKKRVRRSCPSDPLEASLRFHLVTSDADKDAPETSVARSVRVRKTSSLADILPVLREKFRVQRAAPSPVEELLVYSVTDFGEYQLSPTDRPLEILLKTTPAPRFIVRHGRNDASETRHIRHDDSPQRRRQCLGYPALTQVVTDGSRTSELTSQRGTTTPDLVGDCRRKPFVAPPDYEQATARLQYWSSSPQKRTMAVSDSKLDAILDRMSDDNRSIRDKSLESNRGRKKHDSGKSKRRRSRSREPSVDGRDGEFKPSSKRGSSLRASRSMTNLFQKTFSLRKKENPYQPQTELSIEETSPGVLKIFGDSISPGANYKSILAVATSTAKELVKEAIERYGLSRKKAGLFVMCDVIGHFMNYSSDIDGDDSQYSLSPDHGLWTEECIRIIGDNERPLVLQKFWKPTEGYARRFELRKRTDLMVIEDVDTSGVNANARKMLSSKAVSKPVVNGPLETSDIENSLQYQEGSGRASAKSPAETTPDDKRDQKSVYRFKTPNSCPFLVNLMGFNPSQDCVLYPITTKCITVGCDKKLNAGKNIFLQAPDISSNHCEIHMSAKGATPTNDEAKRRSLSFNVDIVPTNDSLVTVNGALISGPTKLNNGDMLCFGQHYIFVFRDPTIPQVSEITKENMANTFCQSQVQTQIDHPADVTITSTNVETTELSEQNQLTIQWRQGREKAYDYDTRRLKLSYSPEREDDVLQMIINDAEKGSAGFRLTPAYLFAMAVDYSAAKHDQICTRALLLKLATKIHNSVLRKARGLAEKHSSDRSTSTDNLLTDLCPIILWNTNALELLHHLRTNMADYLMDPEVSLASRTRASIALAGDEVLGTLEEVIMYTFQQTVYYITKALYTCLPALMDNNPFQDDSLPEQQGAKPVTDNILKVFEITLEYMREYKLHPKVISQLICYLFFFTSTSVFNNLMTKGTSEKYFRWTRGVQLRGNLDSLEAWAVKNDMISEATEHLRKLTCLVNVLATPKVQLLRSSWSTLRQAFPELNARQLQHVLDHYEDCRHAQMASWQPSPEELEAMQCEELLESFNSHPPLVFPTGGYLLDLRYDIQNRDFHGLLNSIKKRCNKSKEEDRSTLSTPISNDVSTEAESHNAYEPNRQSFSRRSRSRMSGMAMSPPESWQNSSVDSPSPLTRSTTSETSETEPFQGRRLDSGYTSLNGTSASSQSWNSKTDERYDDNPSEHANNRHRSQNVRSNSERPFHVSPSELDVSFRPISAHLPSTSPYTFSNDEDSYPNHQNDNDRQNYSLSPISNDNYSCEQDQVYMNLPFHAKRGEPGSLNSSISSQTSREVYQFMRNTVERRPPTSYHPKSRSLNKKPPQAPPMPKMRPVSENNNNIEKEIFVDDIIAKHTAELPHDPRVPNTYQDMPQGVGPSPSPATAAPSPSSSLLTTINKRRKLIGPDVDLDAQTRDMFIVDLVKGPMGYGMGLIDGLHTPLRRPGIYIRTLVDGSPAHQAEHLKLGDRILAVNGSSLIGSDYPRAMQVIKDAEDHVQMTVSRSESHVALQITASPC